MAVFNYANREITAKIVYYGPALCGKTTNLEIIHKKIAPQNRGQMLSLATESDRTLFFDLLPVDIGTIGGFSVRIQLYTVPGQTYYNKTRQMVLRGADGVVFVADSQEKMLDANAESMKNLEENITANNLDFSSIPLVIQFNKQDLPPLSAVEAMNQAFNPRNVPTTKAVAIKGEGVMETFRLIVKEVLTAMQTRIGKGVDPAPASKPQQPRPETAPMKVVSEKLGAIHDAREGASARPMPISANPVQAIAELRARLSQISQATRSLQVQQEEMKKALDELTLRVSQAQKTSQS
ncbi:MAG: GTPase domain-containing protein [Nitrospinae bacterium]|nr:GTPase domain-containing protein [Nitrospinota bacterium]